MSSHVDLGEHFEAYVMGLVQAGRYRSRSEVFREGVRLLQAREKQLADLDAALARGLADAEAGRVIPIEDAFQRIRERLGLLEEREAP